jgi:hypothetical protein
MKRSWLSGLFILSLAGAVLLIGCDQRPVVPTVAVEPTQPVIVVVVTATSQPTLAPSSTPEPTITPIPTLTPAAPITVTATIAAPTASIATAPPVTAVSVQPTVAQVATTEAAPTTGAPASFAAPNAIGPVDLFIRPGDVVKFTYTAAGPLAADQCYRFIMYLAFPGDTNSVNDYWVPQVLCGNQANAGDVITYDLKPARFRDEPNYGGLIEIAEAGIPPSPQYDMWWTVDVVRLIDSGDPIHPNVEAISPASAPLRNTFSR